MSHKIDEWKGAYPSNWKGVIVPEAMSHPAKYSNKLIRKIYEHMIDEGWVKAGDRVIDPFGGVALGALDAMRLGLDWTGIELEEKFYGLGNQNINLWLKKFGRMPNWGTARLLHGDSRKLLEIVAGAHVSVSSPPYAETDLNYKRNGLDYERPYMDGQDGEHNYGATDGQLGAMKAEGFDLSISSPPFLQSEGGTPEPKPGGLIDAALYKRHAAGNASAHGYGQSDGQLSSMKDGSFEASVSSPPFGSQQSGQGIAATMRGEGDYPLPNNHTGKHGYQDQGLTDGNLASMEGDFEASVSSPPYEGTDLGGGAGILARDAKMRETHGMSLHDHNYGVTENQLANDSGDDFWLAARAIVEQVYLSLAPGGHAVWVTKDYVKNKAIVPFSDQWRQLCEAVGFFTLHEHHAMLVHHKGSQHTLEGGMVEKKTSSKSFFRRLAEKKGSPEINFEVVYCMVKPEV